ncbi:hypothetical protein NC652_024251 [Populus alba x Populus x berolinensis]|nr:hypothetical protein NC652_024251 [Populus alba x Populus x berolinensis]
MAIGQYLVTNSLLSPFFQLRS